METFDFNLLLRIYIFSMPKRYNYDVSDKFGQNGKIASAVFGGTATDTLGSVKQQPRDIYTVEENKGNKGCGTLLIDKKLLEPISEATSTKRGNFSNFLLSFHS